MLQKLPNHCLITEQDRVRYTDGSISATLWFDDYNAIFAFEIIFDLLLDEFAFLYAKNSPVRFVKIDDGSLKPGRRRKQAIESETTEFSNERLEEFKKVSLSIPSEQREFILNIMLLMRAN
jgi:hypothetical protein